MVLGLTFKHAALCCGFVESLFFCAIIFGFNALYVPLKKENLFASYCNDSLNSTDISNQSLSCGLQDKYYGYILITAQSSQCILAFPLSLLYDKIGLKFSKIFVAFAFLFACLCFAFSFKYSNFLVYISAVLFGIVIQMLLYCNYALGDLYPHHKNLIISLISGMTASSALVFLFFSYIHLYGVSLFWLFVGLGIFGFIEMMLSAGLILNRVNEYLQNLKNRNNKSIEMIDITEENNPILNENAGETFSIKNTENEEVTNSVDNLEENNINMLITNNENTDETFSNRNRENEEVIDTDLLKKFEYLKISSYTSLKSILRSPYYICHFFYILVTSFRYTFFLAEIALQLNYHFPSRPDLVNKMLPVISYFFLISLLVCPISGIIIDKAKAHVIRIYKKKWSTSYVYKKYAQCFIIPLVMCSIANIIVSIFIMIPNENIIYSSFFFCSVTRSIFFSFISSFLHELFPIKYFNKILGLITLMLGLINFTQYFVLFKDPYYLNIVNIFLLIFSILTLSYPIYLGIFNNRQ